LAVTNPGNVSLIPNGTETVYTYTFTITGTPLDGDIVVALDDQGIGKVNGHTIFDDHNTPAGPHCTVGVPNCTSLTPYDITAFLHTGVNTFEIDGFQSWAGPDGVLFDGHVSSTPEPGTSVLMGGALLAVAELIRRRRA
jgi:MYXO-CTERM domain-containing protein